MKNLEFHADWKPTNANGTIVARSAITVGAGVQDGELFEFAGEHDVIAAGGTNLVSHPVQWRIHLNQDSTKFLTLLDV